MTGQFQFYPSLATTYGLEYHGHPLNFWENNSLVTHKHALLGYPIAKKGKLTRERLNFPPDFDLIGDSGGYQMFRKMEDINKLQPETVINWYHEMKMTFGTVLDLPPGNLVPSMGGFTPPQSTVIKCAEFTLKNAQKMADLKGSTPIYSILQGANLEQIETWFDKAVRPLPLDGIATTPKVMDPLLVALQLCYIHEQGLHKNLHGLALTGTRILPVLIWATKYFDKITVDSSSFMIQGFRYRKYLLPGKLTVHFTLGNYSPENFPRDKITEMPCNCSVCTQIDPEDFAKERLSLSQEGYMISFHNLAQILLYHRILLFLLRGREESFIEYVRTVSGPRALQAIDLLEFGIKEGARAAFNRARYAVYKPVTMAKTESLI